MKRYIAKQYDRSILMFMLFILQCLACGQTPGQSQTKRPFTVADSIRMTRFADSSYGRGGSSEGIVANFSPDGRRFVVVLRKGNLEQNTNEYSIILFTSDNAFKSAAPRVLVTFASSSNREAIKNVTWLPDNDTLLFLGERAGQRTQLFSLQCNTRRLVKLTNHNTNLVNFARSVKDDIVYVAESPVQNYQTNYSTRNGFHISDQGLASVIIGHSRRGFDHELYIKAANSGVANRVQLQGKLEMPMVDLAISPDGQYLILRTEAVNIPDNWANYEDKYLQVVLRGTQSHLNTSIHQLELVELSSGRSQRLLDAPLSTIRGTEVAWAHDSKSVVVTATYLPLSISNPLENDDRRKTTVAAEVGIACREVIKITDQDLRLIHWDYHRNLLKFKRGWLESLTSNNSETVFYRKNEGRWTQVSVNPEDPGPSKPDIVLAEDLNSPPRIFAVDHASGRRSLLLDLNPQFRSLTFGRAEEVTWQDKASHDIKALLYLPPDYVPGKRYPLVIQTHGVSTNRFWVDGPWTTGLAAQPLANKGFVVLQLPDTPPELTVTPEEGPSEMRVFETAVDFLDRKGLIDRSRVGLIGFSRTCFHVLYFLTHSKYRIAAASIADGVDASYFQYMAFSNSIPNIANESDVVNRTPPFGDGLLSWIELSPSFRMDTVQAPLLIQAIGPTSLIGEWDWFTGLSRLGKPVDLVYLSEGAHILEKPWERMVSQQGNVDWFSFWLKGVGDVDPANAKQYTRWSKMQREQEESWKKENP